MKLLFLFIILFVQGRIIAQPSDFILLKKKNKTITNYYSGNTIAFTTTTGAYINATISKIKNDTIFLQEFIVRQIPTRLGVYVLDTVGMYRYQFHYNQLKSITPPGRHFNFYASGASLLGGGILITLGSGIVYLADRKKFSPELLIAGAALGIAGYFMTKNSGKGMVIGKKYKLVYVETSSDKKE